MILFILIVLLLFFTSSHPFMRACYYASLLFGNKYEMRILGKYIISSRGSKVNHFFLAKEFEGNDYFLNKYDSEDFQNAINAFNIDGLNDFYLYKLLWVNEMGQKRNWYDQCRVTYFWLKVAKINKIKHTSDRLKIQVDKILESDKN